jgi:hypothetical protein
MGRKNFVFTAKKLELKSISKRVKKSDYKESEEYAVLKVGLYDSFDGHALKFRAKKQKAYTLMCFDKEIFERLVEGEQFTFTGTISLDYGSCYFCVERVYDEFGFDICSEDSLFFKANKVVGVGEVMALGVEGGRMDCVVYPCQGCGKDVLVEVESSVCPSQVFCDGCQDMG